MPEVTRPNADVFNMDIGKQLKKLCKERDLTISQLARATKIPLPTLNHIANGRPPRKLEQIKRICDYFEISSDELLFGIKSSSKSEVRQIELIDFGTYDVFLRKK